MKWLHGHHVFVQSVGVRGGLPLDGFSVEAVGELGVDISRHQPRTFDELEEYGEDFTAYDMIVSFSPAAHRRALEFTRHAALVTLYWPTTDPTAVEGSRSQRLDAYRETRDQILRRIETEFGRPASPGG